MKKLFVLFTLLLTIGQVFAQIVNIPDPNFKWRLLNHTSFGGEPIDTNFDNQIQVSEAEAIVALHLGDPAFNDFKIADVTGIAAFENITYLNLTNNNLTLLNLENNNALQTLYCVDNQLTSIDLEAGLDLKFLDCSHNQLTQLPYIYYIEELYCSYNNLSSVLTGSEALRKLVCNHNPNLSWIFPLYSSLLEELICHNIDLWELDLSDNPALRILDCHNNGSFFDLDVSNNTALEVLNCSANSIEELDLSQNTALTSLNCADNQLEEIYIRHLLALNWLDCGNNQIDHLDFSRSSALEVLHAGNNSLVYTDVSVCVNLLELNIANNDLMQLLVKNGNNTAITSFNATDNPDLICIHVDDVAYSTDNWPDIDPVSHFVATQQECESHFIEPQWKLKLYFEDAIGAKDTLTIGYDPTASIYAFDFEPHFGEIFTQIDTTKFNVYTRKSGEFGQPISPPIGTDLVMKKQVTSWIHPYTKFGWVHGKLPVIMTWDEYKLDSPDLPVNFIAYTDYPRARIDMFFNFGFLEEPACAFNTFPGPQVILSRDISYLWPLQVCRFSDELVFDGFIFDEIAYSMESPTIIVEPYKRVYWMDIGVEDISRDKFRLYPNPVTKYLYLDNKTNHTIKTVKIFSVLGKLVQKVENSFNRINVSNLTEGIYFVKVSTENGDIVKKIVKQ